MDDFRGILTSRDEEEVRRAIASLVGQVDPSRSILYRFVPPDRLNRFEQPDGREVSLEGKGLSHQTGSNQQVIPLELEPGNLWGYWVVSDGASEKAETAKPMLLDMLRHLEHLESDERLRHVNQDMLAIFGLGHSLAQANDPIEMVEAVHRVAEQVVGAASTHFALPGHEDVRLFTFSSKTGARSFPVPLAAWKRAFTSHRSLWDKADETTGEASRLLDADSASGMLEVIGDVDKPVAYLVLLRADQPFTQESQALFARIADFVFVSLMRWEQLEGARRKSKQVADLFVLLAQEKERLDYVMRSVPVGLLLTDSEGNIQLANDTAGKALGLTDVELREKKVFGSRKEGRELLGLIQKARNEEKVVVTPYEMDGRWFQLQVVPWPGGAQYLVVTQDVQDWHQLNRLKEDLISIISHETKNPLTAVINAGHLLSSGRTGSLNESQKRVADLILENSRRIKNLLDDVVRLSRVYQLSVQQDPVPLKPILEKLRDGSKDMLHAKLISWREELSDITVSGEPRMVENLLTNLIGNAIKYTGIGGHVGIRLWRDDGLARLRVCDDGPGIPAREKDRIFSPFFRASNVKEQVSGTGLGLVIAKNIAERMGGRITLESPIPPEDLTFLGLARASRPGTAFQVDLPLAH